MSSVLKLCLVTDGSMPVPSVKGGAVSTLIDFLVNENEKHHRAKLYIFSPYDEEAVIQSRQNKYSKFIYKKTGKMDSRLAFASRLVNKASKIIRHDEIENYVTFYKRCSKTISKINPDFVVCEGGPLISGFHCFRKDFPAARLCLHLHGKWHPSKMVSETFDHVMSCSGFIENEYKSVCSNKQVHYKVVYNCANTDKFKGRLSVEEKAVLRKKMGFSKDDFVVIFCGRICADKGVKELLDAVLMSGPRVKALILGSINFGQKARANSYLKTVEKLAREYPCKIQYTGYVKNEEVWKYHQCADCMAVPSIWDEPAGISLIEGLTSGLPMVVTRSGGIPEEVNNACAFIIDRGRNLTGDMAAAFNRLSREPKLVERMGKAAEERSKLFSVQKYYQDYISFFEENLQ